MYISICRITYRLLSVWVKTRALLTHSSCFYMIMNKLKSVHFPPSPCST